MEKKEKEIKIPKDLYECFEELKKLLNPEDIEEIKKQKNEDGLGMMHHGLGRWLRNNWGLWGESVLSKWFNKKGIGHPDDMSGIIIFSFWKHLNNEPINLDEQVGYYQEFWNQALGNK